MGRTALFCVLLIPLIHSCGPAKKGLFADRRTEHQKYGDKIKEAGLDQTSLGRMWFDAANKGLSQPLTVSVPYREGGYFAAGKPAAAGYLFTVRRGDRITLDLSVVPDTLKLFFAELWKPAVQGSQPEHLASMDSTRKIVHDVEEDGNYIVRIQPPLLESVEYQVTIQVGPSLAFPVNESGNPRLISFWSDPRDGGARSHQGVDISAKFRSPAIASANGIVSRVMENRLGGKVVFMRPEGKNYSLYYAHLDSQTVRTGEKVTIGQVLGLVGNTGNARGTVPHLHFGIYGWGGAIDPLPFIDTRRKEPPVIADVQKFRGKWMRTIATTPLMKQPGNNADTQTLARTTAVYVNAVTSGFAKVQLANGQEGFVATEKITDEPISTQVATTEERLLDQPATGSPSLADLETRQQYEILGRFGDFELVKSGEQLGWRARDQIAGKRQ